MATIKEIAELTGLSRATVSAVLNAKQGVREKTRDRVLQVIREHDLQHGLLARSLMGHFSQMIGVVVPNFDNPFYTELLSGFSEALKLSSTHMVCHPTGDSMEDEIRTLTALSGYDLGGYALLSVQEGTSYEHVKKIQEEGKPLVAIGPIPGIETHSVAFADQHGSKQATDYLIKNGHRQIVCLAARRGVSAKERVLGFMESLLDHNLPFDDSKIVRIEPDNEKTYRIALEALQVDPRPTALLCYNDVVAAAVYRAAYDLELRIPEDVSVIGFDDIPMAAILGPPLTTVSIAAREAGHTAAEILLQVLSGEAGHSIIRRVIQTKLVIRSSVARI